MSTRNGCFLRNVVFAALPVIVAGALGSLATRPNIPTWYEHLAKPPFNPPNWVFAPAWSLLYLLMAYAFFRVLRGATSERRRAAAIFWFLVQISLNAIWSWVFFAAHSPMGGLVVISVLFVAIGATILAFWRIDGWAGVLLVPYLAWVGFAAVLNLEILRLNDV